MPRNKVTSDPRLWLHCDKCLAELPAEQSPAEYSKLSVGVTDSGEAIVWCNRHHCGVVKLQLSDEEAARWDRCSCGKCSCEATAH